jgi:hypothetical protein
MGWWVLHQSGMHDAAAALKAARCVFVFRWALELEQ